MYPLLELVRTNGFEVVDDMIRDPEISILRDLLSRAMDEDLEQGPAGLVDSSDLTNKLYSSRRSPGVGYLYLEHSRSQLINHRVAIMLRSVTGINWLSGINQKMLPIFTYSAGSHIKAHRGRDIGYGANDLVAVGMLSRPGTDFTGGRFYLNPVATASADGKTVENDLVEDRIYIELQQGQLLVFNNNKYVHGTEPIGTKPLEHRITCSWRTAMDPGQQPVVLATTPVPHEQMVVPKGRVHLPSRYTPRPRAL